MKRLINLVIVVGGLGFASASQAFGCDVTVDFHYLDDEALFFSAGWDPRGKAIKSIDKLEQRASSNIDYLNELAMGEITFCRGNFIPETWKSISGFAPLRVDPTVWGAVSNAAMGDGAKRGSLPKAVRGRARQEANRICGLAGLLLDEFADFLRMEPESDPPPLPLPLSLSPGTAENPVKVIVSSCSKFATLSARDKVQGLASSGSVVDLVQKVALQFQTYSGRALFAPETATGRENERPFLRNRRRGIYVDGLESRDAVFVHEMGHYLGLSHLGRQFICNDEDSSESGVADTPAGVPSLDGEIDGTPAGDILARPRAEWPESCQPAGTKIPLDNLMNSGSMPEGFGRFSDNQIAVMKRMSELLNR